MLELYNQKHFDHMYLLHLVTLSKKPSKIKGDLTILFLEKSLDKTTLTTTILLSPSLNLEKKEFKQMKICIKAK